MYNPPMRRYLPLFFLLLLILPACGSASQGATVTATLSATSPYPPPGGTSSSPYPPPVSTSTPPGTVIPPAAAPSQPAGTAKPMSTIDYVTPGMPVNTACLDAAWDSQLNQAPFGTYPQAILDALNGGASVEALDQALYDLGIANIPVSNAEADLTGDGIYDRVVSIINPLSESLPPAGRLLVYTCSSGQFALSYDLPSPDFEGAPGIRFLQDMNFDRRAEVVISLPTCGASTCFENAQILSWDGEDFTNRLEGSSGDLPYPSIAVSDDDGDQFYNLEVTASGSGSAGAGPQRTLLRIWIYQSGSKTWVPGADIPGASGYRIHILHDADTLAAQGDLENAVRFYQRVASDSTLMDWADPETEQANLGAYARYRLVVLFYRLGQLPFVDSVFSEMESLYPLESPQRPYVDLARVFLSAFRDGDFSSACQVAREYASAHENEILLPLGQQVFGFGNKEYTPEGVCEW